MKSLQEKLTFWRLLVVAGILLVVALTLLAVSNIERINYYVHGIALKMQGAGFYESGDNLKYLSKGSKGALKSIVESNPNVAAIQVINVDFKRNMRYTTYFVSSDDKFLEEFSIFQNSKTRNTTLFTSDEAQNDRVVKIINNNFICDSFSSTMAAKMYPTIGEKVSQACSMSVPPFPARFVGYVNVFLYKTLTKKEEETLKLTISTVASSIYERDVVRKN